MIYDGICRRVDLLFRSRYPYLNTKIFKISDYEYHICITDDVDNFDSILSVFNKEIKFLTAPVKLENTLPSATCKRLSHIRDHEIPSNFEGIPFTNYQLHNHIASSYPNIKISGIKEDHHNRLLIVGIAGKISHEDREKLQHSLDKLKSPYSFIIKEHDVEEVVPVASDPVFSIVASKSMKSLQCQFLERDEDLWFKNVEDIYKGAFRKEDLYFYDNKKTSCLVNFSMFSNANIRNHLLLYDVVYCTLPLLENMREFLEDQKISRDEIVHLASKGRLKILNLQPETRMDYGFLNEIYSEKQDAVVSRRALSALCAIDLVDINRSYILSDPEIGRLAYPLLKEFASIMNKDVNAVSHILLWPKQALRMSFDSLNETGPMGIARYGVNKPIIENLPHQDSNAIEFEFTVNSDRIHLAYALDATYFPFFTKDNVYTDHPYSLMMGNLLNFYKSASINYLGQALGLRDISSEKNPSLDLISLFEINDYVSISEFEEQISSSLIRAETNSLFSELSSLEVNERNERIHQYNSELERVIRKRKLGRHALDLSEDAAGLVVPLLGTGKKIASAGVSKLSKQFPAIHQAAEYIKYKVASTDSNKRKLSVLAQINRVARLKRDYK